MNYFLNLRRGYTLLETVLVIGFIVLLSGALTLLFLYFNSTFSYEKTFIDTETGAGAITRAVERYATQADRVVIVKNINGTNYVGGANTLILEVPSIDVSNVVVPNTYDYVVYYINGANAYELFSANAASARTSQTKLLSDSVSSLAFTYSNADLAKAVWVEVDAVTQNSIKGQTLTDHLHERVYLRNISL